MTGIKQADRKQLSIIHKSKAQLRDYREVRVGRGALGEWGELVFWLNVWKEKKNQTGQWKPLLQSEKCRLHTIVKGSLTQRKPYTDITNALVLSSNTMEVSKPRLGHGAAGGAVFKSKKLQILWALMAHRDRKVNRTSQFNECRHFGPGNIPRHLSHRTATGLKLKIATSALMPQESTSGNPANMVYEARFAAGPTLLSRLEQKGPSKLLLRSKACAEWNDQSVYNGPSKVLCRAFG